MVKKSIFYGDVKDGDVHLDSKVSFKAFIKTLERKRIELTIAEEGQDVTTAMWAYLYSVVYPAIALESGYTVDEVDGILKKRHLTVNKGTKREYVKDKSKVKKKEISDYIDLCIADAAGIGVVVPPPNKLWRRSAK